MSAVDELRRRWQPMDPAAGTAGPDRATREAALATILATSAVRSPAPGKVVTRRWVLAGAGAAAVSVAVAAAAVSVADRAEPPGGSLRITPAMLSYASPTGKSGARAELERIADAAAATSEPPSDLPEHLKIRSWSLHTRVDDEVSSQVVLLNRETWRAADDSGRSIVKFPGENRDDTFGPGEFGAMWPGRPPTDTEAAGDWLAVGHPRENGPAEVIVAVTDLARERVLTPAERAAVLRVVAKLPGLKANGAVKDRAGRNGQAFSVESTMSGLPTRHTLIVDPVTGKLFGYEEMLTKDAGKLNVAIPSVINYECYLVADHAPISPR